MPGMLVKWKGVAHEASVDGPGNASVVVPAADLAEAGSLSVTVLNVGPGGGESKAVQLTIRSQLRRVFLPQVVRSAPVP
jgi:hypothetical protein